MAMPVSLRAIRACLLIVLLVLGSAVSAYAQFRAGIQGTVTDSSGAAVPGATIVITNQDTGVSQEAVSGEAGFYRVSGLAPGRYRVKVSLPGFKEALAENVTVTAEEIRGLDMKLETGNVQETITVTAAPATLHTENGEVAGTLSTVEIQRLPQIGRDPYELIRLTPGVFGLGARSGVGDSVRLPGQAGPGGSNSSVFQTENQVPISANGQRVEGNNFQLDGVTAMSQAWGGAAVVTPNQESVKEIRVISSTYSAENGRNTGATVQVVSQNGTNDFHGSAVFKRNTPGLNAYQKWGGPHGEKPQRVNQLLSQAAGSIGGPIMRNKLFFFFSYEGQKRDQKTLSTEWFETPELVNAIKTLRPNSIAAQILNFPGMTPPRFANVLETRDVGSLTGVPGEVVGDVGGGLDGIPDIQRGQIEGYNNADARQFNTRVDFSLTQNDLIAFSTYFVPNKGTSSDAAVWGNTGRPFGDFTSSRKNMVGTLLWTRTLSSTMINEARFNVTRWYFDEVADNPEMPWGIPRAWVNQNPQSTLLSYGPGVGPGVFYQTTYNFRDTLTKVINTHALKFGGDIIREQNNDKAPWAGTPEYHFNSLWSFANDAPGDEVAFFDPTNGAFTELTAYARSSYYALFAQDDWKVRSNLTLNLGIRYEYFAPLTSANDHIANLILGPNGSLQGASIKTGGELFNGDKNNFAPQIGFAWSPGRFNERLVVRGGFGMGYNRLPGSRLLESRFNPPFFAGFTLFGSDILYTTAGDLKGFDYPNNPAATLTFDPATNIPTTGPPVNVNATLEDPKNPIVYRYSAEGEYDLGHGWVASVGYQGSSGRNLTRVVPYQLFVDPNPRLGNINLMLTDGDSKYNALLTRITRRFADGFLLNAEYRLAKSEDTCSSDGCKQTYPFDIDTERGPSDFDVRHVFKAFGTWDLPILRGRDDALEKILGNWQLSGIVTYSSGFPWTPIVGGGLCGAAVAGGGVCPLRPTGYTGGASDDTSNETFMQQFGQFTGGPLNYFTLPPAGSFETPPRPGIGRNSFRGPHYFAVDAVLAKRFVLPAMPGLGNNAGIEIRANAYNLFNNLNLAHMFSDNIDTPSTRIDDPDFGRARSALAGRVIEFQARFSF
jgi:hypothetical protein